MEVLCPLGPPSRKDPIIDLPYASGCWSRGCACIFRATPPPQVQSPYHINGMHQQDAQALRAACLQLTKTDTQQQHPPPSEGSLQACPVVQCPQHDPVRSHKNPSQVHAPDVLTSTCLLCCMRTCNSLSCSRPPEAWAWQKEQIHTRGLRV